MTTAQAARARTGAHKPAAATAPPGRRRPSDFACKQVMAVTGLVFGLFVLVHMLGNLKAYLGRQEFESYAVWLRHMLEPVVPYSGVLWVMRAVLLACLVGHVSCAYILWRRARIARGPFRRKGLPLRSFAARTMPVTGVVLLLFIIFHILDLTTGTRPVASAEYTPMTATRSFAYDNLVHSFDRRGCPRSISLRCCCWACTCRTGCGWRSMTWARPGIGYGRFWWPSPASPRSLSWSATSRYQSPFSPVLCRDWSSA